MWSDDYPHEIRCADGRGGTRKTMIVALARKLLIALWRLATTGEVSDGCLSMLSLMMPDVRR
jgi:hypothetical protein